jgi:hypothetical protein
MQMNPDNPSARLRDGLAVAGAAKPINASCDIQFLTASCTDVEKCFKDVP